MAKHTWLCLPKQPTATCGFLVIKVSLLVIFLITFWYEALWSVYCMRIYRAKVEDIKASSLFPSRSEIQVYTTHSHFFLFTGLMSSGAVLIGVWGILMEYLVILVGYCYIHTVCTLFEIMGAYFSEDDQVALYKVYGVFPEPFLIIFGLIFAHMVRVGEKEMSLSPLYKKKMAERAGKGETMAYTGTDIEANNNEKSGGHGGLRGHQNPALDLGEDVVVKKEPSPSSSGNSSRTHSLQEGSSEVVTVVTDGSTRIHQESPEPSVTVSMHEEPQTQM